MSQPELSLKRGLTAAVKLRLDADDSVSRRPGALPSDGDFYKGEQVVERTVAHYAKDFG